MQDAPAAQLRYSKQTPMPAAVRVLIAEHIQRGGDHILRHSTRQSVAYAANTLSGAPAHHRVFVTDSLQQQSNSFL
ncbi:hypothetical protein DQ04_03161000 [Trypanosoma grayi]|uniref:hypothetical protein n=1 Tax=Trypanosoma grayi TaxID=71804 RepID=UPI0004F491CA|nr:hypothetical protein DQ04_03161000 [Trypanosoma grayi]KEG10904.1 hypothetical protein DQ04_03161000 [Trypanosoma grayi]